jgi:quinol monooxygenase YgiN
MKFVQIIEMKTSKIDEIRKLGEAYDAATEGTRTSGHTLICEDRDKPGRYFVIIEFASREEAQKNDALPETQDFAQKQAALLDGPPTFYNLDVIQEMSS